MRLLPRGLEQLFILSCGRLVTYWFLGGALVSLNLASREYINALYARITAVVFLIVILAFFYSSINMADPGNHNIPSTIMPAFAGISIAQFFIVVWNLMVGMKMMKNWLSNQNDLCLTAILVQIFPKLINPPCHKGDLANQNTFTFQTRLLLREE